MLYTPDLKNFTAQERHLLLGLILTTAWDVSGSFQLFEAELAPNLVAHYAEPCGTERLSRKKLESLGETALLIRDDFKKILNALKIEIEKAMIVIQYLDGKMYLGVMSKDDPLFRNKPDSFNPMQIDQLPEFLS
jgi:hypothetical protein